MTFDDPTAASALLCPKCNAPMRSYERNGLHIDRCTECGGLFLDRGELERLVQAEAGYYAGGGAPAPPGAVPGPDDQRAADRRGDRYGDPYGGYDPRGRYERRDDWDDDDDDDYGRGRRGRRGFLDDLFDFG